MEVIWTPREVEQSSFHGRAIRYIFPLRRKDAAAIAGAGMGEFRYGHRVVFGASRSSPKQ
ncbi:hypothetical protein [Gilvibacter sediminis]|uniref:hypothetical protein n=1 Tax=Gilvibacter sediminis TaxID=379071 RepID=UPI0023503223|nr:hypothetical protein [Gilvibacter sediminis]MDC7996923.1 hypothetical protein [Gilvibacter sediminis]